MLAAVAWLGFVSPTTSAQDATVPPPDREDPPVTKDTIIIDATKEAVFDATGRVAVFVGDVRIRDPRFDLACQKLTVYLNKDGGGLERAVAETDVVIVQRPTEGEETEPSVGRAMKADYDPVKGLTTLTGWPEVRQGANLHRAAEFSTRMVINPDGRMETYGASKTLILDTKE